MEKPVTFYNKRGKQLVGMLHLPKGRGKLPLVVICHGFGGTKSLRRFVRLARILEKNKIAAFRFDFEGCGDSGGDLETTTVKKQVADLESVMNWILKQRWVNKNRIGFIGHSLGAVIAAFYVVKTKFPARALVLWAPAFELGRLFPIWRTPQELKKWKKWGYFVHKDKKMGINFLRENQDKDYSFVLTQISAPILIIHGQKDETIPINFSKKLAKNYKDIKLLVLLKADHNFEDYYIQQELIKKTVAWFKKTFKVS